MLLDMFFFVLSSRALAPTLDGAGLGTFLSIDGSEARPAVAARHGGEGSEPGQTDRATAAAKKQHLLIRNDRMGNFLNLR